MRLPPLSKGSKGGRATAGLGHSSRFSGIGAPACKPITSPGAPTRLDAIPECPPLPSCFKNDLVFYRPVPDDIEVARVLHGARDIPSILSAEFRPDDDDAAEGETE
jgi:hypothetical protein